MQSAKNPRFESLLQAYGESHQNPFNKSVHWWCVPLIFFSIFGLVACIPVPSFFPEGLHWANVVLVLVLLYYAWLSPLLALGFLLFGGLVALGNQQLLSYGRPYLLTFSLLVFFLAWAGQFAGHAVEGKKPSFLKDIQFLLIGPAWLMHFILKKLRLPY